MIKWYELELIEMLWQNDMLYFFTHATRCNRRPEKWVWWGLRVGVRDWSCWLGLELGRLHVKWLQCQMVSFGYQFGIEDERKKLIFFLFEIYTIGAKQLLSRIGLGLCVSWVFRGSWKLKGPYKCNPFNAMGSHSALQGRKPVGK